MNYLLSGGYDPKKLNLMLSLTSIRSEDIKSAISDHLVRGASVEVAAAMNSVDAGNLKRSLKTLNTTVEIVEQIKQIDAAKVVTKVTKKSKFNPLELVPNDVNFAAWSDWVLFRKEKRKPLSKRSAGMQLKMLAKYNHIEQQEIINSSIKNDYQGLFEPKRGNYVNSRTNASGSHAQRSASDTDRLLSLAAALENGNSSMGANGAALPQSLDCSRGAGADRQPSQPEFQLMVEEDGTADDRRICEGARTL